MINICFVWYDHKKKHIQIYALLMNFIKTAVLHLNVIPQHQQSKTLVEGLFFENISKFESGRRTQT